MAKTFLDKLKEQCNFYIDCSWNKLRGSYHSEIEFDPMMFINMPEAAQKDAVTCKLALLKKMIEDDIKRILEM